MSRFQDDELPLDELDPCCQKELAEESARARITKQLRKSDRSMVRYDMRAGALDALRNSARCACCVDVQDYYLLASLRQQQQQGASSHQRDGRDFDTDSDAARQQQQEEEEEEDDEFADLGLDCYTDYEVEAMERMKSHALALQRTRALGFSMLLDGSAHPAQLLSLLSTVQRAVLFIYDDRSERDAYINLCLEGLAVRFSATLFRRVRHSSSLTLALSSDDNWNAIGGFGGGAGSYGGALGSGGSGMMFVYRDGQRCGSVDVAGFTQGGAVDGGELEKWLEHAHVLLSLPLAPATAPPSAYAYATGAYAADAAYATAAGATGATGATGTGAGAVGSVEMGPRGGLEMDTEAQWATLLLTPAALAGAGAGRVTEEEEEGGWCDEPGCGRRYRHEHVGKGGRGLGTLLD